MRCFFTFFILLVISGTTSGQCSGPALNYLYTEGFETSDGGWFPGGTASDWVWGTPTKPVITAAASGTKCWITGGLTGSSYNNGENSWLQSPCFDFSTAVHPQLSFAVFWEMERRFDGASLEYSTDGAITWHLLGSVSDNSCIAENWFNNSGITYLSGSAGWSGNIQPNNGSCQGGSGSNGWLTAKHDLTALAGMPNVIFRFRFGAGTTCNAFDGFAIDDIHISESTPNSADFSYTCGDHQTVAFISDAALCATTYTWDFGDPASGAANTSSLPNPSHYYVNPGFYTVTLTVTFNTGAPAMISHSFEIADLSIQLVKPIACNADNNGALNALLNGTGPFTYVWNTSPPQTTLSITNLSAGTYTITATDPNSCSTSSSYNLVDPAVITVNTIVTDAACGHPSGTITANASGGTPPFQYTWSTGATTPAITGLAPGNYNLQVKDANNCTVAKNGITIKNSNTPVPVFLGADTSICPGQTVLLSPGVFQSYLWQDNSSNSTFTVTSTGQYHVLVTNAAGCTGSDTINVTVDCSDIHFPGAFTPDNDGLNDYFGPLGNLSAVKDYSFFVYDRYGERVFFSTDPYQKWDGTQKGGKFNSGVFAWFATYEVAGQKHMQKGTVILLR